MAFSMHSTSSHSALFAVPVFPRSVSAPGFSIRLNLLVCNRVVVSNAFAVTRGATAGQVLDDAQSQLKDDQNRIISIYDTTLRDGAQMVGISLTLADKIKITRALVQLGVEYIEGGWPGSNPKDAQYFKNCKESILNGQSRTRVAAFGSTRRKNCICDEDHNVKALLKSGADVITLVAKAWDIQVLQVLETTLEENLNMISETISYFKVRDRETMLDAEHFFDGFKSNRGYALECLCAAARAGVDAVVLCDTNGGSMPWFVEEVTKEVKKTLREWPHVRLGIHTHNDADLAVANSLAAVRGGACIVQGCINGYGERTGNANLISVIGGLQVKLGYFCIPPQALQKLSEVATTVAEITGQPLSPCQPYVGLRAFAHKGGIHVAAIRKLPESYNHMDPRIVGNTMHTVVSELSGKGNILDKAEKSGLVLDKESAGSVLAHIKRMENEGCAFENASASVDMLIVRRGKSYVQPFKVLEFTVISSNRGDQRDASLTNDGLEYGSGIPVNQAIVKVLIGGLHKITAAEGIGPVDALSHALRLALEEEYPQLCQVELLDYHVRLLEASDEHRGTMSTTRVTIDFTDAVGNKWTTVGANTSIVEASFRALVDGLEFGIVNCSEEGCLIR